MAVTFDATGGGSGSATNTVTWTHTLGAAGAVVAAVSLGASTTTQDLFTCSATCGGTAMTSLGKVHSDNATNGYVQLFGLTGVSSGAKTVTITASGTPTSLAGGSVSYAGAGSFGTAVTAFGNSAAASAAVTGTATTNMVAGAFGGGSPFGAATTGTSRILDNFSAATGCGELAMSDIASAAGTVTLTRALTTDFWGAVVVEVKASATTPVTLTDAAEGQARGVGSSAETVFAGPAAGLVSDFTVMPSFFDGNYGGTAVIGGQLVVPTISSYAAGTPAVQRVSLVGSQFFCQVVQASGASGTRQNSIKLIVDATNSVEMLYGGGVFTGRVQRNGTNSDITLATYNSTTHQWWRMRESGGTIFWDTAPDGLTWTNLGSAAHLLNLSSLKPNLQAGYYGTETAPPNAIYDNLNSVPVAQADPVGGTGRALDALDGWNAAVQPNTTVLDTAGPPVYAPAPAADGVVQPSWALDSAGPPVYAPRAGADTVALGVVAADPAGGLARSSSTADQASGGGTQFDAALGTVRALGGADGVGLTDLEAGGSSQVQALGAADAVGVTVVDSTGLARASSTVDADPIGDTVADVPATAAVRALGAVDVRVGGTLLSDAAGGVVRASGGGPDAVAVGVTALDAAGPPVYAPRGGADFTVGGALLEPAGIPVRAVWSPDVAAIQASSADTAGVPVRALGAGDYLANSGNSVDPSVGASRALNTPDVTPRVDVVAADTSNGIVRLWAQTDAWSAWQITTPGITPGPGTFPGQSPDTAGISRLNTFTAFPDVAVGAPRALGTPVGVDVVVGATAGGLSNLPILRVLADFTQGPPNQPASTAGGTTVELTQSMAATAVTVRRGRQYELGKPQAGTAVITFSDPSELLNPTNPSSPYNSAGSTLVSYRPMRVTAVWRGALYTIYTGYIERYPQTWTDAGFRGVKPLECVDGLAMLANTSVHQSYYETVMADNPAIYIPYNESSAPANVYLGSSKALLANGTSLPGNPRQGTSTYYQAQLLVGGTALRVVPSASNGGQVSFGGDTMPDGTPALTLSSKLPDPTSTDTSRATARVDTGGGSFSLNTAGSTIECWFRWTIGTVNIMVCEAVTNGEFDYANGSFVGLYTTGTGRLGFSIGQSGGYQFLDVSPTFGSYTGYPDGQWHYAALTFSVNTGGNVAVTCTLDFNETIYSSAYTPAQIGVNSVHTHATSEFGDPESQVSVAQFAYYPTPLTQNQRIRHANRGFGNSGDPPLGRFARLINTYWKNNGWGFSATPDITPALDSDFVYGVYPVPGNDAAVAAQVQPYTVQQAIQMVDTAEQGMSYFTAAGVAQHEPRNYRINSTTSLGTFGDRPGELPYTALEFDFDPTYVYTQTQITKVQGGQVITNDNTTAKANYGVRTFSDTVQLRDEFDLFQLGMHILSQYGTQRVRIRRIEIDPAAVGSDALWQIVLGLELSQRFTVNRRTANGTLFSQDYFVEQIEHQIDPAASTWVVRLQLSPVLYASAPGVVGSATSSGTLGVGTVVTY